MLKNGFEIGEKYKTTLLKIHLPKTTAISTLVLSYQSFYNVLHIFKRFYKMTFIFVLVSNLTSELWRRYRKKKTTKWEQSIVQPHRSIMVDLWGCITFSVLCIEWLCAAHHYSKHWLRTTSFKVYSFCSKVCLVISILNTRNRGLKRTDLGMDKVGEIVKPLSFSGNICPCYTGAPFNS